MVDPTQPKRLFAMKYKVKEVFYTLQGEGAHTGRPAVFCRFSGCNLWSGREEDRATAVCRFCDTDFRGTDGVNGGRYDLGELVSLVSATWGDRSMGKPFVVCTGGEPLLQLDAALVDGFHRAGFEVAVETNGTVEAPVGIDWICMSPKAGASLRLLQGHELKLVFPQPAAMPVLFEHLDFEHFFLQPMDGPRKEANTRAAVRYCLENPRWRLSIQTHKWLDIP